MYCFIYYYLNSLHFDHFKIFIFFFCHTNDISQSLSTK